MAPKAGRPPRTAAQTEAIRDEIARHALSLYRQEGFAAVSIRRLAAEVGCAPMTIYAHFADKTEILQYLWADVLREVFEQIEAALLSIDPPRDRLEAACRTFVSYWLTNPGHFRLVFLSGDVDRADVARFMKDPRTGAYFAMFDDLVRAAAPAGAAARTRADALVAGMIGIALCRNTIADHPWSDVDAMTARLLAGVLA